MTCEFKYDPDGTCIHYISTEDIGLCRKRHLFLCTEDITKAPLSFHAAELFRHCRQAYHLSRIGGIRLRKEHQSAAIGMGAAFDQYMRSRYLRTEFTPSMLDEILAPYKKVSQYDRAKLHAVFRAMNKLGIQHPAGDVGSVQHKFELDYGDVEVVGYIDMRANNVIIEDKFSGKPEWYLNKFSMEFQLGTYLLACPDADFVSMRIVRVPQLKYSTRKVDMDPGEFKEKCYQDIISRPSFYFLGWDPKTRTYSKLFSRREFDLDALKHDYEFMGREIRRALDEDGFYQNKKACLYPFQCDYLSICTTRKVSDELYETRETRAGTGSHSDSQGD